MLYKHEQLNLHHSQKAQQPAAKIDKMPPEGLVYLISQGQHLAESSRLLTSHNNTVAIEGLTRLLHSDDWQIKKYALLTLVNIPHAPRTAEIKQALLDWLRCSNSPPQSERDCIETMKVIQKLEQSNLLQPIQEEVSQRLQSLLFFLPRGGGRDIFWPRIWITASRLLAELGYLDKLKEVACSGRKHYLSAAGAIALATDGFMEGSVVGWLASTRDYHLLTAQERGVLTQLLKGMDNNTGALKALQLLK